ncbi:DUF998 domain-containing protein [soil metagenome]
MTLPQISPPTAGFRSAIALAVVGATLQLIGLVVSAVAYTQNNVEPYSCLNHFISELGWPERSSMAWLFNGNLMVGSLLFAPLLYMLGRHLRTRFGYVAMLVGFCSLLFAGAIGYFPIMKHLKPHLWVAFLSFAGWGATGLLFAVAFWARPGGRRAVFMILAGAFAFLVVAAFLLWPKGDLPSVILMLKSDHRPVIWWPAVLEWGVLVSFYLWVVAASLALEIGDGGKT